MISQKRRPREILLAKSPEVQSFTTSNVPGSGITGIFRNVNASLDDTYTMSPNLINEASAGYHRTYGIIETNTPVTASPIDDAALQRSGDAYDLGAGLV